MKMRFPPDMTRRFAAFKPRRPRSFAGLLCAAAVFVVVFASPRVASAYPWMIRHDHFTCTKCHADPSGGELLKLYGRTEGWDLLPMQYGATTTAGQVNANADATAQAQEPGVLWNLVHTPKWLLLGGSYRHMTTFDLADGNVRWFPMQADLFGQVKIAALRAGGTIGVARVPAGSPNTRAAQITTNQGDGWNLLSRTHYVGVDFGGDRFSLRAGRLNLPFGLRIPEHVMWVRDVTRTDRESDQQHGVAFALSTQSIRGEVMAVLGNYQVSPDDYRERGYSLFFEGRVWNRLALGLSSRVTRSEADLSNFEQTPTVYQAHGAFARFAPAKWFVVLAEGNALHTTDHDLGYVGMAQLDFEFLQGLHFGGAGELLDRGYEKETLETRRSTGFGKPKFGGWLTIDWFFLPQLNARVDLVLRQQEHALILAQLHAYL